MSIFELTEQLMDDGMPQEWAEEVAKKMLEDESVWN